MADLPNRCVDCRGSQDRCDSIYVTYIETVRSLNYDEKFALSNGWGTREFFDLHYRERTKLKNELINNLGSAGCSLSEAEIRQNIGLN